MYADNGKTAGENDAAIDDIVAALQPRDMGGFEKGTQRRRRPLREPLVAGHAHSHGERNALPVCRAAPHDHVPGTLHRLRLPRVHAPPFWPSSSSPKRPIRHRATASCGSSAATEAMIYRSLLAQVLVYFLVPLGLAVCHSACAIGVLVRFPAGRHWRVLGRPHHDGRRPHARHLRRLHARDLPGRPRHRQGFSLQQG